MNEPSSSASNGSPNGNGSTPPASGPLARLPGETGTAYTNRARELKAQQEREAQEARAQQDRARLDALTSQAAQLVQTLERVAATIPPDLSAQLAAVRSETRDAWSAAAQAREVLTQVAETTAQAREWHAALTGVEARLTETAQAAERTAATSYQRAAAMVTGLTWRVWATAAGAPVVLALLVAFLLWAAPPLRASVAWWLMTEDQRREHHNGQVAEAVYLNPRLPAAQRCAVEAAMAWPHRGPGRCPTPPTAPGSSRR